MRLILFKYLYSVNINKNVYKLMINPNKFATQKIEVGSDILEITPLGSGCEVGRSCVLLKFCDKTVMFDCGIHPAFNGLVSLPYFDEIDPSKIDLLLVTHFHLDHCGALPYFLEKTEFNGKCFMTHPTKAIYKLLLSDYVKVSHVNTEDSLFDERDLNNSLDKINEIDYHQEFNYNGINFSAYNAGHVLGAAMFLIIIKGIRILYTGDFSREEDRHLKSAEIPKLDVHVLIIESTYGVHIHEPRLEREETFTKSVGEIVLRKGKCLLPVFALGRAQELLLILDEYWIKNEDQLKDIPIYYPSSLANKCMKIFQTYKNMMGDRVKKGQNSFNFKYIKCVNNLDNLNFFEGPGVVMASPGMLQNGLSRNLFDKWCTDSKNGIIITGYCVQGTLARFLLSEPQEVTLTNGSVVRLKMEVKSVTFSAHSDFSQTSDFIDKLKPMNIVLVHGDGREMERLKNNLQEKYANKNLKIYNPKNCQKIQFPFKTFNNSQVVGKVGEYIKQGILYKHLGEFSQKEHSISNYKYDIDNEISTNIGKSDDIIMDDDDNFIEFNGIISLPDNLILEESDLERYTQLKMNKFKQMLSIVYTQCKNLLLYVLSDYFSNFIHKEDNIFLIENIKVIVNNENVVLEWYTNPTNDAIADSIALLIYQMQNYPNSDIFQHYSSKINFCNYKNKLLINFLKSKYGKVIENEDKIIIQWNGSKAEINCGTLEIVAENEEIQENLGKNLDFFFSL